MRLFYSRTELPPKGYSYRNPNRYSGPEAGVEHVLIHGDWPWIACAYRASDVVADEWAPGQVVPEVGPQPQVVEPAKLFIPNDWTDLPFNGKAGRLTLKKLAWLISGSPVMEEAMARRIIAAEIARRLPPGGEEA